MASKLIIPLQRFDGGINTSTNSRDIEQTEYTVGDNIDSAIIGRLRCIGKWDTFWNTQTSGDDNLKDVKTVAGYGLQSFRVDRDFANAETNGHYIAVFHPDSSAPEVRFYVEPFDTAASKYTIEGELLLDSGTLGSGNGSADASTKIDYLSIDGALRVFDHDHDFSPQKFWYLDTGYKYFGAGTYLNGNANSSDLEYSSSGIQGYKQHNQFVVAPTGGSVKKSTNVSPELSDNQLTNATEIGLVCHQYSQTGNSFTGWGDGSASIEQAYKFYASFVYDGNQESLTTNIGDITLGGHEDHSSKHNDVSFIAVVRPRASTDTDDVNWNPRITSVRIYYRKADADENIIYFIGDYPTRADAASDVCKLGTNNKGYAYLEGDGTGKGASGYSDFGVYHKTPPIIFTHAVKSGIRPKTTSVECRYKTGVIINRKLYVGNIKQKTEESPTALKSYPDRLLKSINNRFDVLPDTEFVDVAIRDGENIVKLTGFGNRLLQFKENTLYVIMVAGGEEYLEAKYPDMGVRHPNAVTVFEQGVFWVNEFGAYVFNGEGPPVNLISNKIDPSEWSAFITDNVITGFYPLEKKLIVIGDSSDVWNDGHTGTEIYFYNLLTQSWNVQLGAFPAVPAEVEYTSISNIINYTDESAVLHEVVGKGHTLLMVGHYNASYRTKFLEYKTIEELSADYPLLPVKFITKELTGDSPHQRKTFYGCYITYKGLMSQDNATSGSTYIPPAVKLHIIGYANNSYINGNAIKLEGKTASLDFENSSDWKTAHYVVASGDKSKVRNVYAIRLEISPDTGSTTIDSSFQINDISLIFRVKSVK